MFLAGRITGAVLTASMGWIHLRLWIDGYRDIPTIGALFLLNALSAGALAAALLAVSTRYVAAVAAVGALFHIGTLAALVLSLTTGLFGFTESPAAPLLRTTFLVGSAGFLVLAALTLERVRQYRRLKRTRRTDA